MKIHNIIITIKPPPIDLEPKNTKDQSEFKIS
jgi:hypothetical protein